MARNFRKEPAQEAGGSPPSEAWLFAQAILGKAIPSVSGAQAEARAKPEELERLAQFSSKHADELRGLQAAEAEVRHDRELLEWAAQISTRAEDKLRALQRQEAGAREGWRRAEQFADRLLEGSWDPSEHPRAPKGQPDGGQWVDKGGGGGAGGVAAAVQSTPSQTAAFYRGQTNAQLAAFSGAQSSTWPTTGPASSWLPKVGSGAGAGAAVGAGIGAGAFLGGLRNASMGAYWARVPGAQAMPQIWVYELEKRVRAGKLSREDAIAIFNTAVLGAAAQGFKPTGGTMSAVHNSAVDFLGKAEAVYFARKKKKAAPEPASLPGAYLQSGGRVFPTERNSGLTGDALAKEQQRFCERGLAQGKSPGVLRGQASVAGLGRGGGGGSEQPDHIDDPGAEAALQRAIRNAEK